MLEPKAYSTVEHQWEMKGVDKELIQKELSRYALRNRAEFEAELISATLRGKTFSKELLSYSNLNSPEKMNELAGKLLGYASGKDLCTPSEDLRQKFEDMMRALYKEEGVSLRIGILAEPAAQDFINTHVGTLDGAFRQVEMSDIMRQRLSRSNYVFSGMKAFHELNEAFPSLLDEIRSLPSTANIQTKSRTATNTRENMSREISFDAYLLTVYLANECHLRDQERQQTANGSYDGTIKQSTLAEILTEKAACMEKRLSPVGCLVIIARLFYVAFLRKKTDGCTPVFRGISFIE